MHYKALQKKYLGIEIIISMAVLIHCSVALQNPKCNFMNNRKRNRKQNRNSAFKS